MRTLGPKSGAAPVTEPPHCAVTVQLGGQSTDVPPPPSPALPPSLSPLLPPSLPPPLLALPELAPSLEPPAPPSSLAVAPARCPQPIAAARKRRSVRVAMASSILAFRMERVNGRCAHDGPARARGSCPLRQGRA